jgi:hypothetical protein
LNLLAWLLQKNSRHPNLMSFNVGTLLISNDRQKSLFIWQRGQTKKNLSSSGNVDKQKNGLITVNFE